MPVKICILQNGNQISSLAVKRVFWLAEKVLVLPSCNSLCENTLLLGLVGQLFQLPSNPNQVDGVIILCDCSLRKDNSQELPCFNQKQLEKCSVEECQLYQPKPVAVETVDPNRT